MSKKKDNLTIDDNVDNVDSIDTVDDIIKEKVVDETKILYNPAEEEKSTIYEWIEKPAEDLSSHTLSTSIINPVFIISKHKCAIHTGGRFVRQ